MKTFKTKKEVFNYITELLGFSKIIITGSTALQMWGLVKQSSQLDLDLVIYDIIPSSWDKLTLIHKIYGTQQVIYPAGDTTREVGALVSLKFPTPVANVFIEVHIFCMEKAKMKWMNRPFFELEYDGSKYLVNHPVNIIEAKKFHARAKDYKQLAAMCSFLMEPLPELKEVDMKSTNGCSQETVSKQA